MVFEAESFRDRFGLTLNRPSRARRHREPSIESMLTLGWQHSFESDRAWKMSWTALYPFEKVWQICLQSFGKPFDIHN
jgi:hypothetical protein